MKNIKIIYTWRGNYVGIAAFSKITKWLAGAFSSFEQTRNSDRYLKIINDAACQGLRLSFEPIWSDSYLHHWQLGITNDDSEARPGPSLSRMPLDDL